MEQETVSGSGISWAIGKFAPRSRQITTPAPHYKFFFTNRMPFLPPNQQRQSTEGITLQLHRLIKPGTGSITQSMLRASSHRLASDYCRTLFFRCILISRLSYVENLLILMWKIFQLVSLSNLPSVLWCGWLGGRNGIQPVKNWVVGCWHGYLERSADLHMAQLMPLPLSCLSKIQIGFTILIPAHQGRQASYQWQSSSLECMLIYRSVQRADRRPLAQLINKGPLNVCVCVCSLSHFTIKIPIVLLFTFHQEYWVSHPGNVDILCG